MALVRCGGPGLVTSGPETTQWSPPAPAPGPQPAAPGKGGRCRWAAGRAGAVCVPASAACWRVQKSIAALALLALCSLLPSSQLRGLALRAGRAGQLEVSSLQHRRPASGPARALLSAFVSLGGDPTSGPLYAWPSLGVSHLLLFCPASGATHPRPPQPWDMLSLRPEDVICH